MTQKLPYRHDVDGLRAIAVLMVFLFHLDVIGVAGGFVGVDVFYVISGFVIFRKIVDDLDKGTFSITGFYARRVRRIFPALAFLVIVTLFIGYFLTTPLEFEKLSGSSIATLFSVSNFYFYDRINYFAASVNSTPLVHTWSLGIEEQFYLLAPLFLTLIYKYFGREKLLLSLLSIVVFSFLYNLFALYVLFDEKHAFYLPMSRFWEIGAGGLAALLEVRVLRSRSLQFPFSFLGFAGLFASATLIDENMAFPGFTAVLPVGATVLLILAKPPVDSLHYRFLTFPLSRFFGQISYSVYLFHWPLIVFYGLYVGREFMLSEKAVLFLVTVAFATFSLKFIESPFRAVHQPAQWRVAFKIMASAALVIFTVSLAGILSKGLPFRLSDEALKLATKSFPPKFEKHRCFTPAKLGNTANVCSQTEAGGKVDFLLWGDSHAGMYSSLLQSRLKSRGVGGVSVTLPDCQPIVGVYNSKKKNIAACWETGRWIIQYIREHRIPVLVLASRWANLGSPVRSPGDGGRVKKLFDHETNEQISLAVALAHMVEKLKSQNVKIVIIGPVPEVNFSVPNMLARSVHLGRVPPRSLRQSFNERQKIVLKAFSQLVQDESVDVVYPHKILCNDKICRIKKGAKPLYSDDDHLSRVGVELTLPAIVEAVMTSLKSHERLEHQQK